MNIVFHARAEAELSTAVAYYEKCQTGLGMAFAGEVYATVARVAGHPQAWMRISRATRRCLISRFPYGVIYQQRQDCLLIVAVANLHRKPGYWRGRTVHRLSPLRRKK